MKQKPQPVINAEKAVLKLNNDDKHLKKALSGYAMMMSKDGEDLDVSTLLVIAEKGVDHIKSLKMPQVQKQIQLYEDVLAQLKIPETNTIIVDDVDKYVNDVQLHINEMNPEIVIIAKTYYTALASGDLNNSLNCLNQLQQDYPEIRKIDQYSLGASSAYRDAGRNGHVSMMSELLAHPLIKSNQLAHFLEGAFEKGHEACVTLLDQCDVQNDMLDDWSLKNSFATLFDNALNGDQWVFLDALSERGLAIPGNWTSDYAIEKTNRIDYVLSLDLDPAVTVGQLYETAMNNGQLEIMTYLEDTCNYDISENDYALLRKFNGVNQGCPTDVLKHILSHVSEPIPNDVKLDCFTSLIKRACSNQETDDVIAYMSEEVIDLIDYDMTKSMYDKTLRDYDQDATNYILQHVAQLKFATHDWVGLISEGLAPLAEHDSMGTFGPATTLMSHAPHNDIESKQWQIWLEKLATNGRGGVTFGLMNAISSLPETLIEKLDAVSIFNKITVNHYMTAEKTWELYDALNLDKDRLYPALTGGDNQNVDDIKNTIDTVEAWQQRHKRLPPAMGLSYNMALYKQKPFDAYCDIFEKEGLGRQVAEKYAYESMAVFGTVARGLDYLAKWGHATKQPFHDLVSGMNVPVYNMNPKWHADAWGDAIIKHGPKLSKFIGYARHMPTPEKSHDGKTWSFHQTKAKVAEFAYERASEHPKMAALCLDNGVTEDAYSRALDIYQNFENNPALSDRDIPEMTIMGDAFDIPGYVFKKLPDGDYRGLFLGKMTDCCQYIGGHADLSVEHGFAQPDSGFYVIEDKKGQIVSQSWAWRGTDGELVFDSLETLGATDGHCGAKKSGRIKEQHWEKIFNAVSAKVEREHEEITAVHIGKGGRTPELPFAHAAKASKIKSNQALYLDDSKTQYRVWKRKL